MADRANLNYLDGSNVSGYAVRTGDNDSPRKFRLVRFDAGDQTELLESNTVIEEGVGYSIKVTRSEDGVWRLFVAPGRNGDLLPEGETVTDQTYRNSSYFGLLLRYSSGNVDGFYFDDFLIQNSDPFRLTGGSVISPNEIELRFNYPVDSSSLQKANFFTTSLGNPADVRSGSSEFNVVISYPEIIPNGEYTVQVENLINVHGNSLTPPSETDISFENPFFLLSTEVTSNRSISLIFSRPPDQRTTRPEDFTINQQLSPNLLQFDTTRIVLRFNSDLPQGEITIGINGLESSDGWKIPDGTSVATYRFGNPLRGDIVINEFLYRRASSGDQQFVELFNTTDQTYDLSGWFLETDRGSANIPPGTTLEPSGYILFTDKPGASAADGRSLVLHDFVPLRTTGDKIILQNSDSAVIDSLTYKPSWGGNESGISLERKDPYAIPIDPMNWSASIGDDGSTPLQKNSQFLRDVTAPNLLFARYQPENETVLIRFDEFIDASQSSGISIDQQPVYVIETNNRPGNELLVEASDIEAEREITVELNGATDFQGNRSGRLQRPVAQPLTSGDLAINEIMYDPLSDDFDQLPNQSDYLELVNRRPYAISLEGIYIHDQPDENGEVRNLEPISSQSKWIPANGFALLYPENEPGPAETSRVGRFFDLTHSNDSHLLQIERTTLSLPLAGRKVYLADSLGTVIDWVDYRPEWHNPNLIDTKGISLERINPQDESASANWGSSTVPSGGTPSAENSLYQTPQTTAETNRFILEPNPFSPDGDGNEDNLFISYSFEDPNYMLRIRIFDRYGRLVRNLSHSHHAGFNGSLIWNGRSDDGVTGRIGIYIIHVEAYNSSNGDKKIFKEVAVLARRF